MLSQQPLEQLFEMRQEYKECRATEDDKTPRTPDTVQAEAARIAELIDKIKN